MRKLTDEEIEEEKDRYYNRRQPPEIWSKTFALILMTCWAILVCAIFFAIGYCTAQ
jgi:hypothetical protein